MGLHVVVVGGGPAGLIAAETLAKGGVETTLVEKAPHRLTPCTGLLTSAFLQDFQIPEMLVAQRVHELAIFSPTQRVAFVTLGGAERHTAVVKRELLQTLLRRRAEEAGVTFVTGAFTRFRHSQGDYPLLEVKAADGTKREIQADVVVAADGVHSRVARACGLPALKLGVVYQERFALTEGPDTKAPEGMQVHFGRKVSADFYGWLLPQRDHLLVGVATQAGYGKRLWDMMSELKKRLGSHLDGAKSEGREAFIFPLAPRKQLAHDRMLFVGDAAGLVQAATRDGLYYACHSGRMAAELILKHQHVPVPERLAEYETQWWKAHGETFAQAARLEETFFGTDRRREALLDLSWDRELQRVAVDAFLLKRPLNAPLPLRLKLKGKLLGQLLKYSVIAPKRLEGDPVSRAMPAGDNYLDLALRSTTPGVGMFDTPVGPLPSATEGPGVPQPTSEEEEAATMQSQAERL